MALSLGKRRVSRSLGGDIVLVLFLLLIAAVMLLPLVYAVSTSLKPNNELWLFPPRFFVSHPTVKNYKGLLELMSSSWVPFSRYLFNTLFVTVVGCVGHIIVASMCAYPLSLYRFPFSKSYFRLVQTSLMFSASVTAIPSFIIMSRLQLVDTYAALILPAVGLPLGLFLMKQFMEVIPLSLIEAARIDGAREMRIWLRIVMPNVKPAWLTLTIFTFQAAWNSTGSSFIFDEELKMLPVAIAQIVASSSVARMGVAMASTVFLMLPPIVLFVVSQSQVIQTMAHAGIKE